MQAARAYPWLRPLLFKLDPEHAHLWTLRALQAAWRLGLLRAVTAVLPNEAVELCGLRFGNRVGLAAGLDKNARYVDALGGLGFGFIEVGTVTPRPQSGQRRPRLWRVPQAGALINRMGFPNDGAVAVAARLARRRYRGICGVNIGKNADTPIDAAVQDYVAAFEQLAPVADYVAINVSSPNTARLRELQQADAVIRILDALRSSAEQCQRRCGRRPPLLLKISPDQAPQQLVALLRVLRAHALEGLIVANSTLTRPAGCASAALEGGLSGAPLLPLALTTVRMARAELGAALPIIGVGGIAMAEDARQMLSAGADLVQVYSALVYRGPALVDELRVALRAHA